MYFQDFDKMYYNFEINGKLETRVMTDITKNVRIRKQILSNITLFDQYTITDGETPESIAELVYGRSDYHWAVLLSNDMYDYLNDFPLPMRTMEKVIIDKYGEDHINDIHHYEAFIDGTSYVVDESHPGSVPVTNSVYEYDMNEKKREIKLISPLLIEQVANELGNLV